MSFRSLAVHVYGMSMQLQQLLHRMWFKPGRFPALRNYERHFTLLYSWRAYTGINKWLACETWCRSRERLSFAYPFFWSWMFRSCRSPLVAIMLDENAMKRMRNLSLVPDMVGVVACRLYSADDFFLRDCISAYCKFSASVSIVCMHNHVCDWFPASQLWRRVISAKTYFYCSFASIELSIKPRIERSFAIAVFNRALQVYNGRLLHNKPL